MPWQRRAANMAWERGCPTGMSRQTFLNDQHCKSRSFEVGHAVHVRIYSGNQKWSYGTVVECRCDSRVYETSHLAYVKIDEQLKNTQDSPVTSVIIQLFQFIRLIHYLHFCIYYCHSSSCGFAHLFCSISWWNLCVWLMGWYFDPFVGNSYLFMQSEAPCEVFDWVIQPHW